MRRHSVRFMIYLVVTVAALILLAIGGISNRLNGWLLAGLMMAATLPLVWFVVSPYVTPGWVKRVRANGVRAAAEVLNAEVMEGMGSRGSDMWMDVPVQVHPQDEEPFRAQMKMLLSEAVQGMLTRGMTVRVRYDAGDRSRVVLDGRLGQHASRRST